MLSVTNYKLTGLLQMSVCLQKPCVNTESDVANDNTDVIEELRHQQLWRNKSDTIRRHKNVDVRLSCLFNGCKEHLRIYKT